MNKPRITKQTLKELRGELWAKQQSQEQNEKVDKKQSNRSNTKEVETAQEVDIAVDLEKEDGMNM